MSKRDAKTGNEQGKVGKGKPPVETRFKTGVSGNPNGRPIGSRNVSTILKEMLDQIAPDSIIDSKFVKEFCKLNKQATNAHATAARILYEGIVKGESWALKEISDRTEGKPNQKVEITDETSQKWHQAVAQLIESRAAKDEGEAAQLLKSVGFASPFEDLGNVG
jgi:hypothetical protein